MHAEYPLLLFCVDDRSLMNVPTPMGLFGTCEEPEVNEGYYQAWDMRGHHFAVEWDSGPVPRLIQEDGLGPLSRVIAERADDYLAVETAAKAREERPPRWLKRLSEWWTARTIGPQDSCAMTVAEVRQRFAEIQQRLDVTTKE